MSDETNLTTLQAMYELAKNAKTKYIIFGFIQSYSVCISNACDYDFIRVVLREYPQIIYFRSKNKYEKISHERATDYDKSLATMRIAFPKITKVKIEIFDCCLEEKTILFAKRAKFA